MSDPSPNYFLDTIQYLRQREDMVIYDRFAPLHAADEEAVILFLREEYERECLEYPGVRPDFDRGGAIWAARIVYTAAQFLLYREKGIPETRQFLAGYDGERTPGAILSADLCLRFLPVIAVKAAEISTEDWMVGILEEHLQCWHYSAVNYPVKGVVLDWSGILENDCVRQLYADRVISRKARALAELPELKPLVDAALGAWANHLWKELYTTI